MAPQTTTPDPVTVHAGWCPDCDLPSVVLDPRDGASSWAECTECGVGWVDRDDRDASESSEPVRAERRAA
jgi:hypothetical protein